MSNSLSEILRYAKVGEVALIDCPTGTWAFSDPQRSVIGFAGRSVVSRGTNVTSEYTGTWDALRLVQPRCGDLPSWAGFLSYELLHEIEKVSGVDRNAYELPLYQFSEYSRVEFIPRGQTPKQALAAVTQPEVQERLAEYSNFSHTDYVEAVELIRAAIRRGEVYQVNLSQQFKLPFSGNPRELYVSTRRVSAANYAGYLELQDGRALISASPELFLRREGEALCSSPIKGTRPRGESSVADQQLVEELLHSEKDLAELAMIVDLVRNDLGRVAEIGSVSVDAYARLETLPQLHHLVADISAVVEPKKTLVDIIKALFPCGSITGAPKIAAMQQISKLERTARGIYTGAIGFLGPQENFQFNVAIRSGLVREGEFIFQSGGGVVIDSDPESEYRESMVKASGLYQAWRDIV